MKIVKEDDKKIEENGDDGKEEEQEIEISDEEMRQIHNWKSWVRREASITLANNLGNTVYEEHIKIDTLLPHPPHHIKMIVKDRVVKVYLCPSSLGSIEKEKKKLSPILTFDKLGYTPTAPKMHNPLSIAKIINQGVIDSSIKVKY